MTEWPTTGVALTHRNLVLYLSAVSFDVTIVTPAEAAVLTSAAVDVTWTFAPGTQSTFRVEALLGGVVVYDSGVVSTATQAHTIPEGNLETGNAYVIRVTVTTTDANTGQGEVNVTTVFAPSVDVVGVTVTTFGDKCLPTSPPELPHHRIDWTQVVPGGGEVFVRYSVWRREAGQAATAYVRIASITAIATTSYLDYNVKSYLTYDYAVTWTATSGADTLVSVKQDPAPIGRVEFDFIFIHDEAAPANYVVFFSLVARVEVVQGRQFVRAWNRQQATAFVGEDESHRISIDGLPDLHRGDQWVDAAALVTRERTDGAELVVRLGYAGELFFANSNRLDRQNAQKTNIPRIELIETFFTEAVS